MDSGLAKLIGGNIAKYRAAAGLTQAQLAECLGISNAFISRAELGKKSMSVQTLILTADTLGVSCDALMRHECPSVHIENVKALLIDLPPEYLAGIERVIRTCVEEFLPKEKASVDSAGQEPLSGVRPFDPSAE